MREIKSQIPLSRSRVMSILRQCVTSPVVLQMTGFLNFNPALQSLYQNFFFSPINSVTLWTWIRRISISTGWGIILYAFITGNRISPLFIPINILSLLLCRTISPIEPQIQNLIQLRTGIELLLTELHQFNPLFEEQKSSSSVFVLDSENDQLYHASGFDSSQVPEEIKCPLTDQIFTTPVTPKDSKVEAIELPALQYWFEQKQKANPYRPPIHPMSRHVLDMKNLVIAEKLAIKAKNFVEKKVARIGDLLIYSSRMFTQLEREQRVDLFANYALLILELTPPKSFQNLIIGLSLFNMLISHLPVPKNQILEALTMYAHCTNFFKESQDRAIKKSKPQNFLGITHQSSL